MEKKLKKVIAKLKKAQQNFHRARLTECAQDSAVYEYRLAYINALIDARELTIPPTWTPELLKEVRP